MPECKDKRCGDWVNACSRVVWWSMAVGALAMAIVASLQIGPLVVALATGRNSPRDLFNNFALPVELSAHAAAGMLAILIGPFQLSSAVRTARPVVHKWLGRIYVGLVILSSGASLLLLPRTHAFGAGLAISIWASLWLICTVLGVIAVLWHDLAAHRRWMLRSYALTWSAVTIRLYYEPGSKLDIPIDYLYPASAVLAVVTNLLLVETLLRWRPHDTSSMPSASHERQRLKFAASRTLVTGVAVGGLGLCIGMALLIRQQNIEAQVRVEARVRTDLHSLKAALISYRSRHGHYPEHYSIGTCEHPAHRRYYDELMAKLVSEGDLKAPLSHPARHEKGFGYCFWVATENGTVVPFVWASLASSKLSTTGEPGTCRPFETLLTCSRTTATQEYCLCLP